MIDDGEMNVSRDDGSAQFINGDAGSGGGVSAVNHQEINQPNNNNNNNDININSIIINNNNNNDNNSNDADETNEDPQHQQVLHQRVSQFLKRIDTLIDVLEQLPSLEKVVLRLSVHPNDLDAGMWGRVCDGIFLLEETLRRKKKMVMKKKNTGAVSGEAGRMGCRRSSCGEGDGRLNSNSGGRVRQDGGGGSLKSVKIVLETFSFFDYVLLEKLGAHLDGVLDGVGVDEGWLPDPLDVVKVLSCRGLR
jgi:hypothetical protein